MGEVAPASVSGATTQLQYHGLEREEVGWWGGGTYSRLCLAEPTLMSRYILICCADNQPPVILEYRQMLWSPDLASAGALLTLW